MKKVLSFVLVLAMVLGCFSMVFAASFSDVKNGDDHEEAINVLSSLGVVSGYSDGTFQPGKVVTRAEMAAFLINALFGEDKQITQRATKFSDVTAAHWASGFVDYANTLDIIAGYTDGTFKPDQTVTYNEAITMVVKALGYRDAALNGTYPASYVNQAKALGLLDEVDGLGTAGAARGDIAQLVFNALGCPIGTVNKDGEWVANKVKGGDDTMLARLGGASATETVINVTDVAKALVDIDDYLGAKATVVKDTKGRIIGIISLESEKYVGKANTTKNTLGDYKLDRVDWMADPDFFLNGESTTATAIENGKEYTVWANFSGKYVDELVSVIDWVGTTDQIEKSDLTTLEKSNKLFGVNFALNDDDEIDTDSFVLAGAESLDDIEKDAVVTVYKGPETEKVTKVEVSTETSEVEMTKRTTSKVYFDGKAYDITSGAIDEIGTTAASLVFEQSYTLYFDYAGNLYAVKETEGEEATELYAILIDAYDGTSGDNWVTTGTTADQKVKLFTVDGETVVYDIDEDADAADIEISFTNAIGTANLGQLVVYTLTEDETIDTIAVVDMKLASSSDVSISSKGVVDAQYYFEEDAVAFSVELKKNTAETKITKVTAKVVATSSLNKTTVEDANYSLTTAGKVDFLVFGTEGADDSVYGFYVDQAETAKGKTTVYFIVDGEDATYTVSTAPTSTTDPWILSKIVVSSSTLTMTDQTGTSYCTGEINITTGVAVKANTVVVDEDEEGSFALDKEAMVYIWDADEEELLVADEDELEDLASGSSIWFFDFDEDDTYEIVVAK